MTPVSVLQPRLVVSSTVILLTGAAAAGKSTFSKVLASHGLPVLEQDLFFCPSWQRDPDLATRHSVGLALQLARGVISCGRPPVLVGWFDPKTTAQHLHARAFREFVFVRVICSDECLAERLKARVSLNAFACLEVQRNVEANRLLRDFGEDSLWDFTVDTTSVGIGQLRDLAAMVVAHASNLDQGRMI